MLRFLEIFLVLGVIKSLDKNIVRMEFSLPASVKEHVAMCTNYVDTILISCLTMAENVITGLILGLHNTSVMYQPSLIYRTRESIQHLMVLPRRGDHYQGASGTSHHRAE